jgi:hypothetical protein
VAPPSLPLDAADAEATGEPSLAVPAPAPTWTPSFDAADDLNGLLAASTPLLSRAFGQAPPPEKR